MCVCHDLRKQPRFVGIPPWKSNDFSHCWVSKWVLTSSRSGSVASKEASRRPLWDPAGPPPGKKTSLTRCAPKAMAMGKAITPATALRYITQMGSDSHV